MERLKSEDAVDRPAGRRARENSGIAAPGSILRPPPRARAPSAATQPGSTAPLSLSQLRRCLPGRARGRGGARGDAGARGTRRGRGPGARPLPGLAQPGCRHRRLFRRQSQGTGGGRRSSLLSYTPPRADTRSFLGAPPHGGGGAEARRARERRGEEQPLGVGSGVAGKETFPSRPRLVVLGP